MEIIPTQRILDLNGIMSIWHEASSLFYHLHLLPCLPRNGFVSFEVFGGTVAVGSGILSPPKRSCLNPGKVTFIYFFYFLAFWCYASKPVQFSVVYKENTLPTILSICPPILYIKAKLGVELS